MISAWDAAIAPGANSEEVPDASGDTWPRP